MTEIISLADIQKMFDSEWILLENPKVGSGLRIESGKLLWHSKDRDEVYRKAREFKPKRSAILFTGKLPQNTAIVL